MKLKTPHIKETHHLWDTLFPIAATTKPIDAPKQDAWRIRSW